MCSEAAFKIGVVRNVETLDAAADVLILAGREAGLSVRDLINLLEAGMSIGQLTDYLVDKLADRAWRTDLKITLEASRSCCMMQPLDKKQLEEDFNKDMFRILEQESEAGLHSTRFRQMIERYGGVETAHQLLQPDRQLPPNTFKYLRSINRRDLAMEFYVIQDKYRPLFSDQERDIARFRLEEDD